MLYDIIVLEPSTFFHNDHMTVIMSYDLCDPLDPAPRSPSIENKEKTK